MSTIKEIAKLTGVSIGTVDRALHNRGRVSEETRNKVLQAAEKTGYTANIFARNLKLSKTYKFCIIMPHPGNDSNYWKIPLEGIEKAVRELSHYKVKAEYFFYNKYDPGSITQKFNKALKQNWDGFVIAPAGNNSFKYMLDKIPEEVPYIFFDSLVPGARSLSYIGQDAYKSGVAAARLMSLMTGKNSQIAIVNYTPEDYHIEQRTKGFCDYFREENKKVVDIIEIPPEYKTNTGKYIDRMIAGEKEKLKGLFVTSASTFLVAQYLKKKKLNGTIKLIGYDLIKENEAYLKEGVIDFIISQMSERQGYEAVRTLSAAVILKQKAEKKKFMQIDIITRENVDYYQS